MTTLEIVQDSKVIFFMVEGRDEVALVYEAVRFREPLTSSQGNLLLYIVNQRHSLRSAA